jgi:transcriptional regulator with XRE-family HTH domain
MATQASNRKFGKFLRRKRAEKRMTLAELGKKSKISSGYLSLLERGKRNPPKETKITMIARALNVKPEEFLWAAGIVPAETRRNFFNNPEMLSELMAAAAGLPDQGIQDLVDYAEQWEVEESMEE